MKIAIIGGGASGIYLSLLLKEKYPSEDINVYEAKDKILTKVKASGNGKCNINNINDNINAYNHPSFVKNFFDKYDINVQLEELKRLSILVKEIGTDLLYPISESAANVKKILEARAINLGVKIHLNKCFEKYEINGGRIKISFTDKQSLIVDRLVFASGTKASNRDDKSYLVFDELVKHGYDVKPFSSALCPIYVKENVKSLMGQRIKGEINVNGYKEEGEILFKKDGLSGIAIFNTSLLFARKKAQNKHFSIKVMKDEDFKLLKRMCEISDDPLLSFFPLEVANYIYKLASNKRNYTSLYKILCDGLKFTYVDNYDYLNGHICCGGVSIDNVSNDSLESNIEKHIFFMGEALDIDAYCGGYNLKWALVSALNVRDHIK